MKIKGAFPIRWAASDGKDGQPGPPGKPGHDGSTARIIYAVSYVMPATPTGSCPEEWSTQPPQQPQVDVSFSGEWSPTDDGSLLAPQPAAGTTTTCTLRIATTEAAQTVHVGVWSKTKASIYVGNIDKPFSTIDYALRIEPTFVEEEYTPVAITVPKAGVHTLCLGLVEDTTPLDGRRVKVRVGNRPVWLSSSLTYDGNGQPLTWTAPALFREGTRAAYANERRGNLLLNTAFVSAQMGKWDIAAGVITEGINGVKAYKGTIDPAAPAEKYLLRQQVYATDDDKKKAIQPNRWYTLSFYAKTETEGSKVWSFVYPSCCDTTAGMMVDGVQKGASPSDASVEWTLTETFVRHSVTFMTKKAINDAQYVLFRLPADSHDCLICMPKLEEGTQATEWTTNASDIADNAAERTGFPIDNGLWDETKVYMWNDTRRDFVDYEFDKTFYKFGVKKKGMTIPVNTPPATSNGDSNWEVAHKIQTLVTDTIFGKNANIGGFMASSSQLQSNNGSLTLNGEDGEIELKHQDGSKWLVNKEGKQVMGVEGGRRVELDPSSKEIRIYDKDGTEVANLSGEIYKDLDAIFGDKNGPFDLSKGNPTGSQTIAPTEGKSTVSRTINIGTSPITITAAARLTFQGTLKVNSNTVQTDGEGMMDYQGRYWYKNSATIILRVVTYKNNTDLSADNIIGSKQVKFLDSNSDGKEDKFELVNTQIDVPAGYHRVFLDYRIDAIGSPYGSSSAAVEWDITEVSYASDFYLSRLFGNGFAYGSSANNYIAAINEKSDDDQKFYMRHKMVSGNCGYDIYKGTIKIMLGGTWYTMSRKEDGTVLLTE